VDEWLTTTTSSIGAKVSKILNIYASFDISMQRKYVSLKIVTGQFSENIYAKTEILKRNYSRGIVKSRNAILAIEYFRYV
jgi:hypothetical protein